MPPALPWLEPNQAFPPVTQAWGPASPAPGLLAAGGELTVPTLRSAYGQGIFPWFSEGQPILWWSPDPRMVLTVNEFRLHPSLKKTLKKFRDSAHCEIRVDFDFRRVIEACASSPRDGQAGTWILPDMVEAYVQLHRSGAAHSIETWVNGELVAACTAWRWAGLCLANPCSAGPATPPKLRWLPWFACVATTVSPKSTANKTPGTWPRWAPRKCRVRCF